MIDEFIYQSMIKLKIKINLLPVNKNINYSNLSKTNK